MMDKNKQKRLAAAGWVVGDPGEFLGLSAEEAAYVELRLALAHELTHRRKQLRCSQAELAKRLKSSQSRVAKMEAGDASVSLDLLIRSLLAMGATRKDLARVMSPSTRRQRQAI